MIPAEIIHIIIEHFAARIIAEARNEFNADTVSQEVTMHWQAIRMINKTWRDVADTLFLPGHLQPWQAYYNVESARKYGVLNIARTYPASTIEVTDNICDCNRVKPCAIATHRRRITMDVLMAAARCPQHAGGHQPLLVGPAALRLMLPLIASAQPSERQWAQLLAATIGQLKWYEFLETFDHLPQETDMMMVYEWACDSYYQSITCRDEIRREDLSETRLAIDMQDDIEIPYASFGEMGYYAMLAAMNEAKSAAETILLESSSKAEMLAVIAILTATRRRDWSSELATAASISCDAIGHINYTETISRARAVILGCMKISEAEPILNLELADGYNTEDGIKPNISNFQILNRFSTAIRFEYGCRSDDELSAEAISDNESPDDNSGGEE